MRSIKAAPAFAGLVMLLGTLSFILGSGGGECDYVNCRTFFAPELIQKPLESPFFLSDNTFYTRSFSGSFPRRDDNPQPTTEGTNLQEWSRYFGGAIPEKSLSFLVYKMPGDEVRALAASLTDRSVALNAEARTLNDAFLKYARRERVSRALDYLAFAKLVEPIAMRNADTGWPPKPSSPPVPPDDIRKLIDAAEQRTTLPDRFIALRYRFQAMRLLFFSGQYAETQKYFERYKDSFRDENSPKYRFMELAAGAYYKDKQYGKANYLFSIVFDRFPPLKRSAYFSFHPMEEADWQATLRMARNNREREVLWQLLGIYADGMAAIDKIYAMNPKSNLLPLLLVREVNKAERAWTANRDRSGRPGEADGPRPDPVVVGPQRLSRIKAIADAGNANKPYLWLLSAAHLFALAGDSRMAETYIDKAEKSMPNLTDLRAQARQIRLFARTRSIESIDRAAEPYLAQEHEWLQQYMMESYRAGNLNVWTTNHLSDVYLRGGDAVRALLLADSESSPMYKTIGGVDAILAFLRSPANAFDRFLVKNYTRSYSIEELQEMRGIHFLYAGNFAEAIEAFKLAGEDALKRELNADPFTSRIVDCHDCDFQAPHTRYTKLTFADRMLSLSRAAGGQGQAAAEASFELANGFYNMSYYGNGRDIYITKYQNLRAYNYLGYLSGNINFEKPLNTDAAERYYVRAFNLSSNREFKAKAAFMAAKAEQNRHYTSSKDKSGHGPQTHFDTLRTSFADTLYYQEILKECGYFRAYVR